MPISDEELQGIIENLELQGTIENLELIPYVIEILEQIANIGDEGEQCVEMVKQSCKEWDDYVVAICKHVTAVADVIDQDHKKVNIVKVAGGSAGVASGALGVASLAALVAAFLLAPPTLGLSVPAGALIAGGCGVGACGVGAGAGALAAGGAVLADKVRQYFNKKEVRDMFTREAEHRQCMIEHIRRGQQVSERFEESADLILKKTGIHTGVSLDSIKGTQTLQRVIDGVTQIQQRVIDEGANPSNSKKISDLYEKILSQVKIFKVIKSLAGTCICTRNSAPCEIATGGGAATVIFAILPANVIDLILTSIDIHKGSKTRLAAELRDHVELLEKHRAELIKAMDNL